MDLVAVAVLLIKFSYGFSHWGLSRMIKWIFYNRAKWTLSHMILLCFYITAKWSRLSSTYILYKSVCRNSNVDTTMSYKNNPAILKNNFARSKPPVLSYFLIASHLTNTFLAECIASRCFRISLVVTPCRAGSFSVIILGKLGFSPSTNW